MSADPCRGAFVIVAIRKYKLHVQDVLTSQGLRQRRTAAGLTQSKLAERIGSSQSRIAKAEASDPNVSVDLLIRALLATGTTQSDLVRLISERQHEAV